MMSCTLCLTLLMPPDLPNPCSNSLPVPAPLFPCSNCDRSLSGNAWRVGNPSYSSNNGVTQVTLPLYAEGGIPCTTLNKIEINLRSVTSECWKCDLLYVT